MKRIVAAALAAQIALLPAVPTAAAPPEPAAEPFPVVVLPAHPRSSHLGAWLTLGAGAGALASSFVLHDRANRRYHDYLDSTDPARLDALFNQAANLDRLSSGTLLAGELLLATGIYLRFLHTPAPRLSVAIEPGGCSARWRF